MVNNSTQQEAGMVASKVQLRDFTQTDWYGFAGAESFPDGRPPLLGEVAVDGGDFHMNADGGLLLVDATGISLVVYAEEPTAEGSPEYREQAYHLEVKLRRDAMVALASSIPQPITDAVLAGFGFQQVL
jgi:hypothetical protein